MPAVRPGAVRPLLLLVCALIGACAPPRPMATPWPESAPASAPVPSVADTNRIYEAGELPAANMPRVSNRNAVVRALEQFYPGPLREQGISGSASIRFVVERDGVPGSLQVAGSTSPDFGVAAFEVIKRMRFHPATVGGVPVRVRVTLPVTFETRR